MMLFLSFVRIVFDMAARKTVDYKVGLVRPDKKSLRCVEGVPMVCLTRSVEGPETGGLE
jgi:hypothetical protein